MQQDAPPGAAWCNRKLVPGAPDSATWRCTSARWRCQPKGVPYFPSTHFLTRVPWTLHFPGQFQDPIHLEDLVSDEFLEISITFEPFDRFSKFKRLNNLEFHQDPEFRDKFGTYIEKSRISGFIPNFGTTKDPV